MLGTRSTPPGRARAATISPVRQPSRWPPGEASDERQRCPMPRGQMIVAARARPGGGQASPIADLGTPARPGGGAQLLYVIAPARPGGGAQLLYVIAPARPGGIGRRDPHEI